MAGGNKLFGGSNMTVLLQNERLPCSSEVFDSLWVHTSDPPSFQGSKSVVDFENGGRGSSNSNRVVTDRPFFQGLVEKEENNNGGDEDLYDACFNHQGGNKKRRLASEQVQFLERNFELENKLEPERKVQLAKELGLQPRQVAIWFQNRRARFKTKQLEKEYGTLKASYDKLKGDYDNLLRQNDKLKQEVNSLKNKLIPREKEKGNSSSENKPSSPQDAAVNSSPNNNNNKKEEEDPIMMVDLVSNAASSHENNNNNNESNKVPPPIMVTSLTCKQEDANSSKSDVLDDSDSPHRISDSSQAFEPDHSDFSQDEEDNLSQNLLTLPCLPKVEASCYHHEPPPPPPENNACGFGFPVEDQAFCFWPY